MRKKSRLNLEGKRMENRNTCFICEECGGCFKHNVCSSEKCSGTFEKTCKGEVREYKFGRKE